MPNITPLTVTVLGIVIGATGLALLIILYVFQSNSRRASEMQKLLVEQEKSLIARQLQVQADFQRLRDREQTEKLKSNKIEQIIEEKKKKLLKVSIFLFHFIDEEKVKDYFHTYFQGPIIESLVSEISGETNGNVKGNLPQILEAQASGKDTTKQTSTMKYPEISLSGMFLQFQKETISNNQVTLGIEEVDIELTELQSFEEEIKRLKNQFGIEIDETTMNEKRSHIKEKAAEKTLKKMEEANGWALIEGKFKITKQGNLYKYEYLHPVNDYLIDQTHPVTISVLISLDSLEENIKDIYVQSENTFINVTIYGKVLRSIDRKAGVWDLQIYPLAIY